MTHRTCNESEIETINAFKYFGDHKKLKKKHLSDADDRSPPPVR